MPAGTLIGVGFVRIDADTSPAMKAVEGLGRIGASALSTALLPMTAAVTAGVGALTASLASAGAAGGAFAAAVVPQFQKITEASEKLQTAEDAEEKVTIAKAHAQRLAKDMGVKYGQQIKITSKMSAEAKAKAQEYNKALSDVTTATNTARKSQAIYDEKMKAMTPATRETAKSFQGLKDDIEKWSDSLSGTTMPIFTEGIEKIRDLLPRLTPFVRAATTEVREFASSFGEGQAGRVFREFGANLQVNAGNALGNFLTALRNVSVGVVGLINAFMPMQRDMSGGLAELTQRFADFGANLGQSEGFAAFLEQARGAVPAIKEFASAVGDVLSAAGPMSGFGLLMLQVFSQIVAAIPTPVLRLLVPAIFAVNTAMKLYAVYQSAAAAATWAFGTSVTASNGAIASSRAALLLFRIQQVASAVATGAVTAAQWAWNAALTANPIGLVVVAIGLLVGGLILAWKKSETFRDIVKGSWQAIKIIVGAVVDWFLGTVLPFFTRTIPAAFRTVLDWVRANWPWLLGALTGPIGLAVVYVVKHWGQIRDGIAAAWNAIKSRVLAPIADFFTKTIPGWAGTARARVVDAWNGLFRGLFNVYSVIRQRVFAPIGDFFTKTIPGWAGTVRTRVVNTWNALRKGLSDVYNSVRARVFSPIGGFFTKTIPGWAGTVRTRVVNTWNALGKGLSNVFGSIKSRVFAPFGSFFTKTIPGWSRTMKDRVKDHFTGMRDGIGTLWAGIKNRMKSPVNWVLDHVWNRGLVSIWGKIAGWIGMKNSLRKVKLLAAGGTVGRAEPGVFNRPTAIVGEGNPRYPEYVIPTDPKYATRARGLWQAAGAHFMEDGGILGKIKGALGSALDTGVSWGKAALNFLAHPVDNARKLLMGPLKKIALGSAPWVRMAARLPRMAVDGLIRAVKSVGSDLLGLGGGGVNIGGSGVKRWTGVVRQALGLVGQPAAYTGITLRRMNQESGGNPRAVNLWDINAKRGYPSVGLMQVIRPTFQANAGRFRKVGPFMYGTSINPLANIYASMRYALRAYGSLPRAYNRAGGYALGTDGSTSGWHWVGETGPELLRLPAGARVRSHRSSVRQAAAAPSVVRLTVENHGVISSRQETLDWLVHSLEQLDRRNRLPRAMGGRA